MKTAIFTQTSLETYNAARSDRVYDEDIRSQEAYLLATRLETRSGSRAGEFHLLTARISQEVGHTALMAHLYDPQNGEPFLLIEGAINQGIMTPYRPDGLHVTHPETGSLGIIKEGYLLAHPEMPARIGQSALSCLSEGAYAPHTPAEYLDLSTGSFELHGVTLGYN